MHFVLLPGLGGTGALFDEFIRGAPAGHTCTAIGYPSAEILNYPQLQSFIRSRLPKDEQFTLIAESFSGPIAIGIAADPPPNLSAVVLCCTFARFPSFLLRRAGALLPFLPIGRARPSLLAPVLFNRWGRGELGARLDGSVATVSPEVLRARAKFALAVDMSPDVSRIRIPALILTASHDRLVSKSEALRLRRLNPSFRHFVVEGPHFLLQTRHEASWSAIQAGLANL
jgi:pimeloyl-ACP methyl ester carboxylesterase